MKDKIYIAAPFFTKKQKRIVEAVRERCEILGFKVYSPMEECIFALGETSSKDIFEENVRQIQIADIIIAVTDGKDVGTLFESGYAYGKTPIVYLWLDSQGAKFNIMLKESANAICLSYKNLSWTLSNYSDKALLLSDPVLDELELE